MNLKQKKLIIDIQLGRRKLTSGLAEIRNEWNFKAMEQGIGQVIKVNTVSGRELRNNLLPCRYDNLGENLFEKGFCEFDRQLNWIIAILNNLSDPINTYLRYRDQYENALILGDYDNAIKCLDKIEEEVCVSLWGLDNRFVLAEYSSGLEKNKEFLAEIGKKDCNLTVNIFADFFSFKAEKTINDRQYLHRLSKCFSDKTASINIYFEEKMRSWYWSASGKFDELLYYNEYFSVIDIYNSFIKVCVFLAFNKEGVSIQKLNQLLKKIENINDIVLDKLRMYMDNTYDVSVNNFDREMFVLGNLYTEGKYKDVIKSCEILLRKHANCFTLYEYYVKSHIMLNMKLGTIQSGSIAQELAQAMYISYVKDVNASLAYQVLCRLERLLSSSTFSVPITEFFIDKFIVGNSKVQTFAKEITLPFINVKFVNLFVDNSEYILEKLEKYLGFGSSLELFKLINGIKNKCNVEKIDGNRYKWYTIKTIKDTAIKRKELEAWHQDICSCKGMAERYQEERISTELFYLYINEDDILKAEELYVKNRIEDRYSVIRMDSEKIYEAIKNGNESVKKSICTPIVSFFCHSNDYAIIFSHTANFMDLNGYKRPLDIIKDQEKYDRQEFIFFLKNVCISEVMDSMYFIFENETEVDSERIQICQFLKSIDRKNEKEYIDEISQILKKQQIMQGIKYIEDVKIDLDIEKIRKQHKENFDDNFKRFKQIEELEVEFKTFDINNSINYKDEMAGGKKFDHKIMAYKEMLSDFRDEVAFGKYGLDQSLGTRIRHGSIQNQLRVIFEKNQIIFVKKSTDDDNYNPSKHIRVMCANVEETRKEQIFRAISNFSEKIDLYLEKLKNKYIKIKTEKENPDGLIDLSIYDGELLRLFDEARSLNTGHLVFESIETFWSNRIRDGLEYAQSFFKENVKENFIEMLAELEENLHEIPEVEEMNLYDSIIRSRTEIQNAVDTVAKWFKLPTKQMHKDFTATILTDTCRTIYKKVFSEYSLVQFEKQIKSNSLIQGKYFSYFVDILIILFTNAYDHSEFVDNISDLKIELEIFEKNSFLYIAMKNNLSDRVRLYEVDEKIRESREKINESIYGMHYENFEGGSGLIKISKILEWNVGSKWKLEFGLTDDQSHFYAIVGVDLESILVKES
mgnify:CR=1 FL=1